ncbi:group I truncated hemoglobin [Roseateles saccharophilus]|uniref:Hemoglobin n=1 Tax=Roseateles saccharophilus TaxID=304 RepID=A0A4R3V442_ROSSA|nr:group 1 truncated hemoglobin [Roseateles saccharophilus]MDG0832389.1 group 1 truncated hemoglobin [Roseateles saccharophilus]TCU97084.1 hemoglobin [Roseateles saccharophilus]
MKPCPVLSIALALALGLPVPARAQSAPGQGGPTVIRARDDALYRELGGQEAIRRFTDDFYDRMLKDARIAHFFDGINAAYLKGALADYFCVSAGGPCDYDGVSMHNAHAGLGITKGDFDALVEDLQQAMDAAGLPFATQNRLLARLAFHHRDIVTR